MKPWSTIYLFPILLWTRSRLPRASKMAESALAARPTAGAKIRPPCTLKHRVQQEYYSLVVNALNRIFKNNLPSNNFKWLLTKLKLSCVRNIIPRYRKRLWNGYPVLNQKLQTCIGNVWEYSPPPECNLRLFSWNKSFMQKLFISVW